MADVDWRVVAVDKITAGKTIQTLGNPFGSLGEGKGKEKQPGTHTLSHSTLPPSVGRPRRDFEQNFTRLFDAIPTQ